MTPTPVVLPDAFVNHVLWGALIGALTRTSEGRDAYYRGVVRMPGGAERDMLADLGESVRQAAEGGP